MSALATGALSSWPLPARKRDEIASLCEHRECGFGFQKTSRTSPSIISLLSRSWHVPPMYTCAETCAGGRKERVLCTCSQDDTTDRDTVASRCAHAAEAGQTGTSRGTFESSTTQTFCRDNGWRSERRSECSDEPLDQPCGKMQEANQVAHLEGTGCCANDLSL